MTGKKIAILTTGGRENGLGHLSRMEELRRELLRRGNEVFFAVHDTGGVSLLKDIFVTSWHLNLEELLTLTSSFDVAVVDSYYAEEECFQALASKTRIAIDDYERIHYPVDAVIRPSIFVWGEKTIQNAKVFEGPEFIVVGEDAKKIRRDVEGDALFISAGGGCNEGVLDVFCEAAFRAGVRKVFVVCGNSRKDICRKAKYAHFSFYGMLSPTEYAEAASRASFALTACGVSLSEMAHAGLPTVGVVLAEDQRLVGEGFYNAGFLGRVLEFDSRRIVDEIVDELMLLMRDSALSEHRSLLGRSLVPGTGAVLMADVVEKLSPQETRGLMG